MPKFTPEHWRTAEVVFLAAGFQFARQEGSHRSYVKPGVARPVVIPAYKEVPVLSFATTSRPQESLAMNTSHSGRK